MSMTSKVNPSLRKEIVQYLALRGTGASVTNRGLYYGLTNFYSLRSIQEATQKLVKDGTLVSANRGIFQLAAQPATGITASAAAASSN